jgi:hypothetical protein
MIIINLKGFVRMNNDFSTWTSFRQQVLVFFMNKEDRRPLKIV